ncbi:uncharacterized protein LOC116779184 [Danaus plexippus]|uniref:uncharacterized protein LOC116779184 n=1 Tax=Danaus plexippus TaxID=13037 RepID=UPI002AB20FC8|nr:uncharacterized protein LOC116779184 [Danaus plexippus]
MKKKNLIVSDYEKEIQSHLVNPVSPGLFFKMTKLDEDSGYQTSYTPNSFEDSEIFEENLNPTISNDNILFTGQFIKLSSQVTNNRSTLLTPNKNGRETPQKRRGTKRLFPGASEVTDLGYVSTQTPTSLLSGGLHRLKVNDSNRIHSSYSPSNFVNRDDNILNDNLLKSFPTTPIKKSCRSNCKINNHLHQNGLVRHPASEIHSIYCEQRALQPVLKTHPKNCAWIKKYPYEKHQKLDIIKLLYNDGNYFPVLKKIFGYLSCEDLYQVTLVSSVWQKAWVDVNYKHFKDPEYKKYIRSLRENQENNIEIGKEVIHKTSINHGSKNPMICEVSPPRTPRSIRFEVFTKAAAMDSRNQLCCIRCQYPAKITENNSGEKLVECTSSTCGYQFCGLCKYGPHPGKSCNTYYDLEKPSPPKRKKSTFTIGSKKSKKNLRRLVNNFC